MQVQRRLLKDKELNIRKALDRLREKRRLLGRQRRRREFPVVSMVGYTNCGERSSGGSWGVHRPPTTLLVHLGRDRSPTQQGPGIQRADG